MRHLTAYIIAAISMLCVSCAEGDNGPSVACSYDIVCLGSQTAEHGSVFSMYLPDSDREIVYTESRAVIDTSVVKVGDRLMLGYVPEGKPYESGRVTVKGYTPIHNSPLMVSSGGVENELPDWRRDGVYLYSIWRAGDYINVRARLTYSDKPREFVLVVDTDEIRAKVPVPTARLVHRLEVAKPNFERQVYTSFDISPLWWQTWIKGLRVLVSNTNLETDTFIFTKN